MSIWRDLTEQEEQEFRKWARDNYKPMSDIKAIWHPVIKDECENINNEFLDMKMGIWKEDKFA